MGVGQVSCLWLLWKLLFLVAFILSTREREADWLILLGSWHLKCTKGVRRVDQQTNLFMGKGGREEEREKEGDRGRRKEKGRRTTNLFSFLPAAIKLELRQRRRRRKTRRRRRRRRNRRRRSLNIDWWVPPPPLLSFNCGVCLSDCNGSFNGLFRWKSFFFWGGEESKPILCWASSSPIGISGQPFPETDGAIMCK